MIICGLSSVNDRHFIHPRNLSKFTRHISKVGRFAIQFNLKGILSFQWTHFR